VGHDKNKPGVPTQYVSKSHVMQAYQKDIAIKFLDFVAEGKTVKEIAAMDGMPTRQTLYRWLTLYKEFNQAYWAAKELSAAALEDDALSIARKLCDANEYTGTRIQAFKEAMVQFRWSAARRDPKRYGGAAPTTAVTVPVQINTTLNLNTDTEGEDGYSFTARAIIPVNGEDDTGRNDTEPSTEDTPDPNEDMDVVDVDPYNAPASVPAFNGRRGPDKKARVDKRLGPRKPLGPRQAAKVRAANVAKRMTQGKD
jgi:hypothetical protein